MSDMIDRTSGDNPLAPSWEPAPYEPPAVVFDDPAEAQQLERDPTFVPVSVAHPESPGVGYDEVVNGRHAAEQPHYDAPFTTVPANDPSNPVVPAASTITMPESPVAAEVTVAAGDPYATMEMPAVAVAAPAAVAVISAPPVMLETSGSIPSPTISPEAKTVTASSEPDVPRPVGGKTMDDHLSFWGALAGSFALVWIIYTQIMPWTGRVGFVILWLMAFLAVYAGVSAMGNPSQVA